MTQRSQRTGLLFALGGFALLSIGDAIVKSTGGIWPGPAIAGLRYAFSTVGLGVILAITEGRSGFSIPSPWIQFGRGAAVAFSASCFFAGLFFLPLAEATTITFINPMLTALLSALILREPANRAVWISTAAAFAGVILVLRPNIAEVGLAALFPLGSALGMALLMVLNRMASGGGSAIKMQFLTSLMATPVLIGMTLAGHASGVKPFVVGVPTTWVILACAIVAVSASCAHICLYLATVRAPASMIAPMTYVQLLTSLTIGATVFGEWPDLTALLGAAIIILSGLWLWRSHATLRAPIGTP
jgi:drug/metabolite transporter (DMT)-like permease